MVFIPPKDRKEVLNTEGHVCLGNYEVRNRKYDTVEWSGADLPSALVIAESFNNMLVDKTWKEYEPDEEMMMDFTTSVKGTVQ